MTESPDEDYRRAAVDLLGAIAYGELSAFERLVEDAKLAPGIDDKIAIGAMATAEFAHLQKLVHRLEELDADTREVIIASLEDSGQTAFILERVRAGIAEDHRLGGRLALWGRRLMGEALTQAQRAAGDRDSLTALLAGGADRPGLDLARLGLEA